MADPIFHEENNWYFWDESWTEKHGPFYSEEEARQELSLYCLFLDGKLPKIPFPSLQAAKEGKTYSEDVWDWYNGPLLGTFLDEKGTAFFCLWDHDKERKYLAFRLSEETLRRVEDFYKTGYKNEEAPPIITYILRTEVPYARFSDKNT